MRRTVDRLRALLPALENRLWGLQDRLAITKVESMAALVLLSLYTAGLAVGHIVRSYPRFGDAFYADADSTFFALAAAIQSDTTAAFEVQQRPDSTETDSLNEAARKVEADSELRVADPDRIDLNHATADEFTRLPGIGPTIAGRIVEFRNRIGRFRTVDQLIEVKGIGPRKLAVIRDLVHVAP